MSNKDELVTKCLRCGKDLKSYKSKLLGYGYHCYIEHQKEIAKNELGLFSDKIKNNLNL